MWGLISNLAWAAFSLYCIIWMLFVVKWAFPLTPIIVAFHVIVMAIRIIWAIYAKKKYNKTQRLICPEYKEIYKYIISKIKLKHLTYVESVTYGKNKIVFFASRPFSMAAKRQNIDLTIDDGSMVIENIVTTDVLTPLETTIERISLAKDGSLDDVAEIIKSMKRKFYAKV